MSLQVSRPLPIPLRTIVPVLKAGSRTMLALLTVVGVSAAVLIARYLVFEAHHGNPQIVHDLLDKVLP